nr:putative reverse transcriptase domain-containing protein [Tanacetum cinerariifolium]
MLKVSPWKWIVRFGKRGKLNPRYGGPFKVLAKFRAIAYKLELPQELNMLHNAFHVSNLKKYYADEPLAVPLDGLHIDDKLYFVENPVEIMDREVKWLKRIRIPIVKSIELGKGSQRAQNVDHSSALCATIKSKVLAAVKEYLKTSLDDALYKKRALFKTMTTSKTFNKHPKHKALYHGLKESILADENAIDKGVADIQNKKNPDYDDRDEDPPARLDQGLKRIKTCKDTEQSKKAKSSGTSKGTTKSQPKSIGKYTQVEETVFKAGDTQVSQDLGEDMGNTVEPPVVKADLKDWFKKPERPPTPDPEWNEGKTVDNKPTQKWLSNLAKAVKSSKTFDDLMSTPIDFIASVMNRLKISDLTQDILIGPAYKILKGTCRSYVELEYNMEECYQALTDQLEWNNPEGQNGARFVLGNVVEVMGSRVVMEMGEKMAEKGVRKKGGKHCALHSVLKCE